MPAPAPVDATGPLLQLTPRAAWWVGSKVTEGQTAGAEAGAEAGAGDDRSSAVPRRSSGQAGDGNSVDPSQVRWQPTLANADSASIRA